MCAYLICIVKIPTIGNLQKSNAHCVAYIVYMYFAVRCSSECAFSAKHWLTDYVVVNDQQLFTWTWISHNVCCKPALRDNNNSVQWVRVCTNIVCELIVFFNIVNRGEKSNICEERKRINAEWENKNGCGLISWNLYVICVHIEPSYHSHIVDKVKVHMPHSVSKYHLKYNFFRKDSLP